MLVFYYIRCPEVPLLLQLTPQREIIPQRAPPTPNRRAVQCDPLI